MCRSLQGEGARRMPVAPASPALTSVRLPRMKQLGVVLAFLSMCAAVPAAQTNDRTDVAAVVDGFYGAMKRGDVAGVMRTVAPDAVFLEGGKLETRAEYETGHLPGDIDFERVVNSKRGPLT